MISAKWLRHRLVFNFTAKTSRAEMHYKDTYFIIVRDTDRPEMTGIGEAPLFAGLSREDDVDYEKCLSRACLDVSSGILPDCPSSIRMGLETALNDLLNGGHGIIFPGSEWLRGERSISINGLIWMGDKETMFDRIKEKLSERFRCLKLKIGGIDFEDELALLSFIRSRFPKDVLELRVDANGAFSPEDAPRKLDRLARFDIHSIEQPIRAGQYDAMARICSQSPIDIALDEELIGDTSDDFKGLLIEYIHPRYLILKPALCGGFAGAEAWISASERINSSSTDKPQVDWWATSALESNIGLNAIAQWTAIHDVSRPQGLGTGALYTNNTRSQLLRNGSSLSFDTTAIRPSDREITILAAQTAGR